jgi:hypothetical protein
VKVCRITNCAPAMRESITPKLSINTNRRAGFAVTLFIERFFSAFKSARLLKTVINFVEAPQHTFIANCYQRRYLIVKETSIRKAELVLFVFLPSDKRSVGFGAARPLLHRPAACQQFVHHEEQFKIRKITVVLLD